jgi:hypothetical protein
MSLFTIDISNILSSPVGTIEEFRFAEEIPADTWEDLVCHGELEMTIKIVHQDYGVDCILSELTATISIPSEGIVERSVSIEGVAREFHIKKKREDTDDISYIDEHDATIDLTTILEQEIVIAGW